MPETLGRRLDQALLALQLAPQGSAVNYSQDVVSPSPTKSKEPPSPDMSAEVWAHRAEQLVTALESMIGGEPLHDLSLSVLKSALRPLAGHATGFAAYSLGTSVDRVTKARTAMGVDPETGLPKPRALTSRELPS